MGAISKEMKELMGEHEAITAYMQTMTRSAEKLMAQPAYARERVANYRYGLYDFRDAMQFHLDIDEKVFRSLFGDDFMGGPVEEHREIRLLLNEIITMVDCTAIEKLDMEELNRFCDKIGIAFKKICRLIELHITRENAILEQVREALNNQ